MRSRVLIAVLALAVIAPPARAAEVSVPGNEARFVAGPGEENELVVAPGGEGLLTFRDSAPLVAGPGCIAAADGAVACRASSAQVDLGDGDDRAEVAEGAFALLRGGPGDDDLTGANVRGGEGDDTLTGTAVGDYITAGPGRDTVTGGAGNDFIRGDGRGVPEKDVLDGGPGRDLVDYRLQAARVRIDLKATRTTTGGPEGDSLAGFEHARGGSGDDVLLGDDGPNELYGGRGRNTLVGGGGDDELISSGPSVLRAGPGRDDMYGSGQADVLRGGPGNDALDGRGGADRYGAGPGHDALYLEDSRRRNGVVRCGAGRDRVWVPNRSVIGRDCERAHGLLAHPEVDGAGGLTFKMSVSAQLGRGKITLRVRGRRNPFAMARFDARRRTAYVRLVVPDAIRREAPPIVVRVKPPDRRALRWVIDMPR